MPVTVGRPLPPGSSNLTTDEELLAHTSDTTSVHGIPGGPAPDTGDDTARIEAALPVCQLHAGAYEVGTVTLDEPCNLSGHGGDSPLFDGAITELVSTSTTADAIEVLTPNAIIRDLSIKNSAVGTPSAGAGVHVTDATSTNGNGLRVQEVTCSGFYDCYKVDNGAEWFMHGVTAYDPVRYGIYARNTALPDGGDWSLTDSTIIAGPTANATAGIFWESGGGVRIANVKINGRSSKTFTHGMAFEPLTDVNTVDIQLVNNSIENFTGDGVRIAPATITSSLSRVTINGNEFQGNGTSARGVRTVASGGTNTGIGELVIGDNVFVLPSGSQPCLDLDGVTRVTISGNTFRGPTSNPFILLGADTENVTIGHNNYYPGSAGTSQVLVSNAMVVGTPVGTFAGEFAWKLPTITSDSSWVNVWAINMPGYRAVTLDLFVSGMNEGNASGAFGARQRRVVSTQAGTPTITTLDTDTEGGSNADIQWVVSGSDVVIQMRRDSGVSSATSVTGMSQLKVTGWPGNVRVYN